MKPILTPDMTQDFIDKLESILDEKHLKPGKNAVGSGIHALIWQLRSGALVLENGRVAFQDHTDQSPKIWNDSVRAKVQERTAQINAILEEVDYHPSTMAELQSFFDELENRQ